MSERIVPVPPAFEAAAGIKRADYERDYAASVRDPEAFWMQKGRRLHWSTPYTRAKDTNYDPKDFRIRFLPVKD